MDENLLKNDELSSLLKQLDGTKLQDDSKMAEAMKESQRRYEEYIRKHVESDKE